MNLKLIKPNLKCYRTPYHYAMGIEKNNRTVQLLSQFGFSTNVFDKGKMSKLIEIKFS